MKTTCNNGKLAMKKIIRFLPCVATALLLMSSVGNAQTFTPNPETFDDGNGDSRWYAENGVWQIGSPTIGPSTNSLGYRTHSGQYCATTGLTANYPGGTDTRLIRISSFVVPAANQFPRLRFWHWFNFGQQMAGSVEAREVGVTNGPWVQISSDYVGYNSSGVWTRPSLDLRSYSGKTLQIAFRIRGTGAFPAGGPGWYLDDVELATGQPLLNNPEGFELGLGDWIAETGTWEVGTPTSGPPANALGSHAYSGTNCAATVLAGDYAGGADCRLVSPQFVVPTADQFPRLRFWHWFNFGQQEAGSVEVRESGVTNGPWIKISADYAGYNSSGVWTRPSLDLRTYAGKTLQFTFRIRGTGAFPAGGPGWYVDEVVIVTGQPVLNNPEGFEFGLGDWSAETGTWEVGRPTYGPPTNSFGSRAYSGTNCAATVLAGDYAGGADCRLVSPQFTVSPISANPALRFRHWYQFGQQVQGIVEIKAGTNNWTIISPSYAGTSGAGLDGWSYPFISLNNYADQTVQVAFRIMGTGAFPAGGPGWYIDDVQIYPINPCSSSNSPPILSVPISSTNIYATTTLTITNIATKTDPSASNTTFAVVSAPTGVTINANTGVLTWTPGTNQTGINGICVGATSYDPCATNSQYMTATNCFIVTVNGLTPPSIVTQPVSQVVHIGQPVAFTVGATGFPFPNYQWRLNSGNISGATTTSYTIPSAGMADIGGYDVVVSNSQGTTNSVTATLGFIDLKMFAGVVINGPIGANYTIQSTPVFGPTSWTTVTNITIPAQPFTYIDYASPTNTQRFYRALPQ